MESNTPGVTELIAAAHGHGGGVRFLRCNPGLSVEDEQILVKEVGRLGYVGGHAAALMESRSRAEFLHRHVVVLCTTPDDRNAVVDVLRSLAQSSPRRHLLVWCGGSAVTQAAAASADDEEGRGFHVGRAACWFRRARPRAAEAWLRAAICAADRRGDAAGSARAETAMCRSWIDRGQYSRAAHRLRRLLSRPGLDWSVYAEAGALWADTVIGRGRLREADAWLHSLEAESAVREAWRGSIGERRARLQFWWVSEEVNASRPPPADVCSAEETGWLALCAWRDSRDEVLGDLVDRLARSATRGDVRARAWSRILDALVENRCDGERLGPESPRRLRILLQCATARAFALQGQREAALRTLGPIEGAEPEAQLLRTLRGQLTNSHLRWRSGGFAAAASGIRLFLREEPNMLTVTGLERLMAELDGAVDEFTAAAAGCAWVRCSAPEVKVAIVSEDGRRLVASCGWKASEVSEAIAAVLRRSGSDPAANGFAVRIRHAASVIAYVAVGPGQRAPLLREAAQALAMLAGPTVRACLDVLELRATERTGLQEILGRSQVMALVRAAIARAAGTSFPVLIEGQSGTGKELVARAIHRLSSRRDRRFLAVNCAALTDDLFEAELFGHARGAFTGAVGPRAGLFEEAHGGTLFLDEVSELSPRAQAKLLRVLQEGEIRRVGENGTRPVDVRIVAATNLPLSDAVATGRFRVDLRFRIAVVSIRVPSLHERLEDVSLLAQVFWRQAMAETGRRSYLGPDAVAKLAQHTWPGNVRELQNVIAALAVAAPAGGRVTAEHVAHQLGLTAGQSSPEPPGPQPLNAARLTFERRHVAQMLARHEGRRASAARALGLTRQGLVKTMRRLGLDDGPARGVA